MKKTKNFFVVLFMITALCLTTACGSEDTNPNTENPIPNETNSPTNDVTDSTNDPITNDTVSGNQSNTDVSENEIDNDSTKPHVSDGNSVSDNDHNSIIDDAGNVIDKAVDDVTDGISDIMDGDDRQNTRHR